LVSAHRLGEFIQLASAYCERIRQISWDVAQTIGDPQRSRRQPAADIAREILEVVGRLEALAALNEETRSSVFAALESGDVPDYTSAYQALFAAVARLSPGQAARVIDATLAPES
jgi:hypothetical protein